MTTLPIRVGLTNVTGLGAVQLAGSLLPALEALTTVRLEMAYLPDRGELAHWQPSQRETAAHIYRRQLPRALSRVIECATERAFYAGTSPLLTLGDIPVRTRARQVVLVQSPHLTGDGSRAPRYVVARALFRANLRYAESIVVQTDAMRQAMLATYPITPDRLHVIAQPPPDWLLAAALQRRRRLNAGCPLSLFYPAAGYPHKNHSLLARVDPQGCWREHVARLVLTIAPADNPNPALRSIDCIGRQSRAGIVRAYSETDGLLFLSNSESYGFPLVEAMTVGLPIICPDLPYAQLLCGNEAIYFDVGSEKSLERAVLKLADRLASGWWPNWTQRLMNIPTSWTKTAQHMVDLLYPQIEVVERNGIEPLTSTMPS